MSAASSNTSLASIVALSALSGIGGAFLYNRYLDRVAQEHRGRDNGRPASSSGSSFPPPSSWIPTAQPVQPDDNDYDEINYSNDEIRVDVLNHLTRVYGTVALTVGAGALGSYVQMRTGASSTVANLAGIGILFSMMQSRPKLWQLLSFGFAEGAGLGELLRLAFRLNPRLVPLALASSTSVMASLSAASLLVRRRSLLYLYGALGSVLSVLSITSFANLFLKSKTLLDVNLYAGLAMLFGYVVADTQYIIERADANDKDFVSHALMLFTDAAGIFTRIAVMLVKSEVDKRKRSQDSKRGRRGGGRRDEEDEEE